VTAQDDIKAGRKVVFTILAEQAAQLRELRKLKDGCTVAGSCAYEELIYALADRLPPPPPIPLAAGERVRVCHAGYCKLGQEGTLIALHDRIAWFQADGTTYGGDLISVTALERA
jgi:hypothetical protein